MEIPGKFRDIFNINILSQITISKIYVGAADQKSNRVKGNIVKPTYQQHWKFWQTHSNHEQQRTEEKDYHRPSQ